VEFYGIADNTRGSLSFVSAPGGEGEGRGAGISKARGGDVCLFVVLPPAGRRQGGKGSWETKAAIETTAKRTSVTFTIDTGPPQAEFPRSK